MSKQGTLSAAEIGYAMAVLLFLQSKKLPSGVELTIDAQVALNKGLKYLQKTGDCLVDPASSFLTWDRRRIEQAIDSASASERLAAIQKLPSGDTLNEQELGWILEASDDKDQFVRQHAFHLLQYADTTPDVVRVVGKGIQDRDLTVQAESIKASSIHGFEMPGLDHLLKRMLEDGDRRLSVTVATALTANGLADDECVAIMLSKLKTAMVKGHDDANSLMVVLNHLVDDPRQAVLEYLRDDEDLLADAKLLFPENEST